MVGPYTKRFLQHVQFIKVSCDHTDGNPCDETATGTMSQGFLKVKPNKCLNYLYV